MNSENSEQKTPKIKEIKKLNIVPKIIGNERIEFSGDGTLLFGIDTYGFYNIYDVEKNTIIRTHSDQKYCFTCADFSPDGKFFASKKLSSPSSIHVWNMEDEILFKKFEGHTGPVQSICFASNEGIVSLANIPVNKLLKIEVKIWDVSRGLCVCTFLETNLLKAKRIFSSPDGNFLVIIYPSKVQICLSSTGALIADIEGLSDGVDKLNFSPDGKKIATINKRKKIKIWNTSNGHRIKELNIEKYGDVNNARFSPDGNSIIFTVSSENKCRVVDIKTGEQTSEFDLQEEKKDRLDSICISPNGRFIASQWISDRNYTIIHEIEWEHESSKVFSEFESFLAVGKSALKEGLFDRAYESFQKALSMTGFEDNQEALEGLKLTEKSLEIGKIILKGEEYFHEHSYEKAEELYNNVINLKELDRRNRFFIYDRLEDIKLINKLLNISKKLNNSLSDIYDPLCQCGIYFVLHKDELNRLLIDIGHLIKYTNLPAHIWTIIGYIYSANSDFHNALEAFRKTYSLDMENKIYHRNYGWALYYAGEYSDAVYEFRKLQEKTENCEDILIDVGVALTGKYKNPEQSIEIFSEVLQKNPGNLRANLYMGELLAGINDFFTTFLNPNPDKEKALHYLKIAEKIKPELFRIKSSLSYAEGMMFKDLTINTNNYIDEEFFKSIYRNCTRGSTWFLNNTFPGRNEGNVKLIDFSADGQIFFTLGEKRDSLSYYVYQDRTWIPVYLHGEKNEGFSIATFTQKADYIASCEKGDMVKLWNYKDKNYKVIRSWRTLQGNISSLAFIKGTNNLVTCGENKSLKLWDIQTGICIKSLKGHSASISEIDTTFDGRYIISASHDRTLKLWNARTGECIRTFSKHSGPVTGVKLSHDNKYIASGDIEGEIKLWDINSEKCLKTLNSFNGKTNGLNFTPEGNFIFISGNEVIGWNLLNDKIEKFNFCTKGIKYIAFSPDDNMVVTGDNKGTVRIWNKYIISEQNYIYYLISKKEEIFKESLREKIFESELTSGENIDETDQDSPYTTVKLDTERESKKESTFKKILKNVHEFLNQDIY